MFLPGTRRVATVNAGRGGVQLTTTSTRRLVTVPLDTTAADVARVGQRVTIELPTDAKVRGTISSVGRVATAPKPNDPDAPTDANATITVKIRLLSRKTALDQAPVTVRFERSRRRNALAIPVTALLARPGGGFAVQLADRSRRIVAVEPGLYTSGNVEISGAGLREGQRVIDAAVR